MRLRTGLALVACVVLIGCGRRDESLAKKAGAKVGETITEFGSGIGAGVDVASSVPVELTKAATDAGLARTVSKWEGRGLSVYVIAKHRASVTLVAKAFNRAVDEIGRSKVDVAFDADDAKYVRFEFAPEMDSKLVVRCVIDVAAGAAAAPAAEAAPSRPAPAPVAPRTASVLGTVGEKSIVLLPKLGPKCYAEITTRAIRAVGEIGNDKPQVDFVCHACVDDGSHVGSVSSWVISGDTLSGESANLRMSVTPTVIDAKRVRYEVEASWK